MDGKAERPRLGTPPCDNKRTTALRANALRDYEGKSSELITPGPRSRVGTNTRHISMVPCYVLGSFLSEGLFVNNLQFIFFAIFFPFPCFLNFFFPNIGMRRLPNVFPSS